MEQEITNRESLGEHCLMSIKDTLELLSGKWKIPILGILIKEGKLRFMDLLREVDGIAAKMLSKELQDLELNELITRTVCSTKPITVEYEVTPYGKTLEKVIIAMANWGNEHRKRIFRKSQVNS